MFSPLFHKDASTVIEGGSLKQNRPLYYNSMISTVDVWR